MINVLTQSVVNKIAAGEVVERPASVLKELIENSIDAGASEIKVYLQEFGTKKIQVIDNGSGIEKDDLDKVFLKHATSKIQDSNDLENIHTFGFRGEAIASISAVSKVVLNTKSKSDKIGSEVLYEEGAIKSLKPSAIQKGTDIQIVDLFENVPARKKFLKSKATENKALVDVFYKFVIANPAINFFIDINGSTKTFPVEDLKNRISRILKMENEDLIEIFYDGQVKVKGFIIHPRVFLKNKSYQYIFVNNRPVFDSTIYKGIIDGFDTFLMKGQVPGFVVFVDLPPHLVDVNVHPRKTEVRFAYPSEIYKSLRNAVNVNLTKFLREQTLEKLNIQKQESKVETETINEPTQDYIRDLSNSTLISSDAASEFESFLLESESTETDDTKDSTYIVEKAISFSHEIISTPDQTGRQTLFLDFANATQLLDSYIVTSSGKSILIIDQHAASERYFYEKFLKQIREKKILSKVLLFPEIVSLTENELEIIVENKKVFNELGFEFEAFGNEEIKFIQVPDFVKMDHFGKLIHRIISDILENTEITNIKDKVFHEIAAILACHTAVRFGDKLEKSEIIQILKNLSTCEDPYNCPHGRPVLQELTKYAIEKKFKRCGI
jgi:DNA mismatch repair protein MutL